MSAFQPISPRAAVQLLDDADVGVDCAQLLTDLAEAGRVKGYARLLETVIQGQSIAEIRDGRIDRGVWKRIVSEGKAAEVYASGSVRLGDDNSATGRVSVLGIRFDEKSVRAAANEHGVIRAPVLAKSSTSVKPAAPAPVVELPEEPKPEPKRPALDAATVSLSVPDAAMVLGLSKGTVYKLMDDGRLTSVKIGNRRLVNADSVRALVQ